MKRYLELFKTVTYFGYIFLFVGCVLLIPLLTLFFYPEEIGELPLFLIPSLIALTIGGILVYCNNIYIKKHNLTKHKESIIVLFSWIITIAFSAIPFALTNKYSYLHGLFEATSGYSTTGLSIVDIDNASHLLLMFRSVMLFFGGIGLVLVLMSLISKSFGLRLYTAEGHNDKLVPNLLQSARVIFLIYFGYILVGTIIYSILGMNIFDALNHSIAAFSTGGFSTHSENIYYYNNNMINLVTVAFMLLGGTNFFIHLLLLSGKFKRVFTHCESKIVLFVISLLVPILTVILVLTLSMPLKDAGIASLFQLVSGLTTTGFNSIPTFTIWPTAAKVLMIVVMLIGGGAGSTAGGIKQYRVAVVCKSIYWNIKEQYFNKNYRIPMLINKAGNKERVEMKELFNISSFTFLYLLVFIIGSFVISLYGFTFEDSMFEFSSALGTVGLSIGITSFDSPSIILITEIIGMFLGRLEIIIVFISVAKIFEKIKNH